MVARDYLTASRGLLAQGRVELVRGDVRQASEKGWGAAAQIVKAIAEQRGWDHRGHGHLHAAVRRLRDETGDQEIRRIFQVANSLHVNFYENWEDTQNVAEGLDDIERFIAKLEPIALAGWPS
ncbi:hypothetical protein GBAR_LOCUS11106 [Geodia barretti]|uniref:Uncharacterized protein n=1 Tax=Geodia barretti TaxID=519541 RepID=A0AA35RWP9_GEOBA|nr:hypothetical protein GBAR_LOCUS11106 [Geodia barretti]